MRAGTLVPATVKPEYLPPVPGTHRDATTRVPTADLKLYPGNATFRVIDLRNGRQHARVELVNPIEAVFLRTGSVGMIHSGDLMTVVGSQVQVQDRATDTGSLAYARRAGRLYWTSSGDARSVVLR